MRRTLLAIGGLAALLALFGCAPPTVLAPSAAVPVPAESPAQGTLVRFESGETSVDVTIAADNPTARDFLTLLPLTLPVEEFAGREKLGQLPRELETAGSPGSDPEDGDLIYFIPWGNIGFYYNTEGIGYSEQTIHLGTYAATAERLAQLEGDNISVYIVK